MRDGLRPFINRMLFERRLGVETIASISSSELGHPDDRYVDYEPAEWRTLQRILPRRTVGEDDVFIDLGSGMGRMVLRAAATYPFGRVIGVERSPRLHEAAERNLEAARHRLRCRRVELVLADVLEYELPDDVTVIFLNNPFTGEIFQAAVETVVRSLDRRPRRLRIIYRNPVEHERLMASGRVEVSHDWRGAPGESSRDRPLQRLKLAFRTGVLVRCYEATPYETEVP